MSARRTIGGIGALLTCPCHAVPLLLLVAGTAGSAWLGQQLPVIVIALGVIFLGSLWLLLSEGRGAGSVCHSCGAPGGGGHQHSERADVLRRS